VSPDRSQRSWLGLLTTYELLISLLLACVSGALILLKIPGLDQATRYSYSIFDLAVALLILGALVSAVRHAGRMTFCASSDEGSSVRGHAD
jgi:hypothetical protein